MSDKKIIIRNCPSIIEFKNMYFCANLNNVDEFKQLCSDCTDCKMKQMAELCEQCKKDFDTTNGVRLLANNITTLLNIQEVE